MTTTPPKRSVSFIPTEIDTSAPTTADHTGPLTASPPDSPTMSKPQLPSGPNAAEQLVSHHMGDRATGGAGPRSVRSMPVQPNPTLSRADTPASLARAQSNNTAGMARRRPGRNVTVDTLSAHAVSRRQTTESQRSGTSRRSGPEGAWNIRRMTTGLFTPPKPIATAPGYLASMRAAITSTWLNVLLVFIPIGWALYLAKHAGHKESISDTAVFVTTFIAIIPLAGLLGFATEEAALRLGQTLGGLLNATLGNAVELIVAIIALIKCELDVVQSSLVGSVLSNILLVLGMCFFAGGVRFAEQTVKSTAAQLNSSLLLIAVVAVLIPSAFANTVVVSSTGAGADITPQQEQTAILAMSHGVAILLLILYLGYLLFQMWTHAALFKDDEVSNSTAYPDEVTHVAEKIRFHRKKHDDDAGLNSPETSTGSTTAVEEGRGEPNGEALASGAPGGAPPAGQTDGGDVVHRDLEQGDVGEAEGDVQYPEMNMPVTIAVMVLDTVLVGVTAEFLVDSINGMVAANPSLSREWVGLILLPIVGNAAEHFTAVSVSIKDKLDLSISVAVGSSIQISLFVIPVIVLLAWCIGKPLTLLFDPYESIVLFLSVIVVNQTLSDGRSNWMEGLVLMFLYLIIAVPFWYYPGSNVAFLAGCAQAEQIN